jgi:hypothetical protein
MPPYLEAKAKGWFKKEREQEVGWKAKREKSS